jgi:lipoprotein-anchoring transpeptidase ErfK/SrfK
VQRRSLLLSALAAAAVPIRAAAHPALPVYDVPEEFLPLEVSISEGFEPYEIHVRPDEFALYWTLPEQRAMRYTVGIGRAGLYHSGEFYVGAKKEWPSWTPTPDMIERQPEIYSKYEEGLPGGLENPLGARALYLFTPEGGDSYLRIHGTNNPHTIGRAVSNGCARLVNDQIIELYERVPMDTRVVLYPKNHVHEA